MRSQQGVQGNQRFRLEKTFVAQQKKKKTQLTEKTVQGDDMKRRLGLFLLVCFGMLHVGSGLRCYKCSDYTGRCENVQECTDEDSCISLSERGGKTIRQCIRYTYCDNSRLSQMFPAISGFTYRCCSSNLCNSGNAVTTATPVLALAGSLLSVWWCWF
ncbi:CD59 glycoprotein-like isoform X2 [Micropterus dolomieu]|uniref:CD59 glycoprotein-like isoform X2 n=1 Tax=Micropterus dolomieu TaxID=147949 RepID=UPI001E8E2CF2|nr:CD59 glycoprotein-like isoform X2 [Micropterus dolomieu]